MPWWFCFILTLKSVIQLDIFNFLISNYVLLLMKRFPHYFVKDVAQEEAEAVPQNLTWERASRGLIDIFISGSQVASKNTIFHCYFPRLIEICTRFWSRRWKMSVYVSLFYLWTLIIVNLIKRFIRSVFYRVYVLWGCYRVRYVYAWQTEKMYLQCCKFFSRKGEHITLLGFFFRVVFSFSLNNVPVRVFCCMQSRCLKGRTYEHPTW